MSSVFTSFQLMFFVMVIVALLTFTNSAPISIPENTSENNLSKRVEEVYNGDITFYNLGLGACGTVNSDSELACAIPGAQFDQFTPNGNPNKNAKCGTFVKVTRGNKSVIVKVVDRCAGCNSEDIDLSPAAFNQIADPAEGRVKGSWQYV
ncbi:hypothetical protein Glove_117g327 [Diversispora epigaea]|uniref:RlpA-like protein double-psi beta-barrel domain-containing protein n=1 Tax=Diversispora epigaea TaxID=1348612 RepID=A0A397J0E7_9GLOM|nr:hypothetical protein Glove_117g327 [Diversispora epigaea]